MTPCDMAATHAEALVHSRPWSEAEFASLLNSPLCFVTGDPRCFAIGRVVADEAELLTLATHPNWQRQGLARGLLNRWRVAARERGANTAFLEVAADNVPALSLYVSDGFVEGGIRKAYYPRPGAQAADAILMIRTLP